MYLNAFYFTMDLKPSKIPFLWKPLLIPGKQALQFYSVSPT